MGEGENREFNPTLAKSKEYTGNLDGKVATIKGKSIVLHFEKGGEITELPVGTKVTLYGKDDKVIGTNTLGKKVSITRTEPQGYWGTSTTFLYEGSTEREGSWGTTKAITGFTSATELSKVVIEFELDGTKYVGVKDVTPFE